MLQLSLDIHAITFNVFAAWCVVEEVVGARLKNILSLVRCKVLTRSLALYYLQ